MFDRVLRNADPIPGELHKLLLANITTDPHYHPESLALVWMQCMPHLWEGHRPDRCLDVAEMMIDNQQ